MVDEVGEFRVAELVALLLRERDSRNVGQPEEKNESPPGLRVDFVFDDPPDPPPVALEVTRLMDPALEQGWAALNPTAEALQATADAEGLGDWMVAVDAYASLRRLRPAIEELMRRGENLEVNRYTGQDLLASDDPHGVVRAHREWEAQGLISIERARPGEGVRIAGLARGRGIDGFTYLLDDEIAANGTKLAEARPRETHLAIEVYLNRTGTPGGFDP